jgi:hypothetical protein
VTFILLTSDNDSFILIYNNVCFIDSFNKVVKECGHVSVMANNAGTVDEYDFEQCIAVNLVRTI